MFLLRLGLRPWRMAPLSQVFSAMAVGFLLLLVGFMAWLQQGLKPVLARLQGEQVITAYIDPSHDAKEDGKIVDTIRVSLGAHAERAEIQLVGPKEFVDRLKVGYPELGRELEDLGPEMGAVVPRYVSVAGVLPDSALTRVKAVPGIESAESSKDRYHHVVGAFLALRWVAKLLAVGLCLALLTGLIHLSKMNSYLHQDALAVLRQWGAGEWQIRAPGILSAVGVGIAGGAGAMAGWVTGASWLARHVRALSPMLRDLPQASPAAALALLATGAALGLLAGAVGNFSNAGESGR